MSRSSDPSKDEASSERKLQERKAALDAREEKLKTLERHVAQRQKALEESQKELDQQRTAMTEKYTAFRKEVKKASDEWALIQARDLASKKLEKDARDLREKLIKESTAMQRQLELRSLELDERERRVKEEEERAKRYTARQARKGRDGSRVILPLVSPRTRIIGQRRTHQGQVEDDGEEMDERESKERRKDAMITPRSSISQSSLINRRSPRTRLTPRTRRTPRRQRSLSKVDEESDVRKVRRLQTPRTVLGMTQVVVDQPTKDNGSIGSSSKGGGGGNHWLRTRDAHSTKVHTHSTGVSVNSSSLDRSSPPPPPPSFTSSSQVMTIAPSGKSNSLSSSSSSSSTTPAATTAATIQATQKIESSWDRTVREWVQEESDHREDTSSAQTNPEPMEWMVDDGDMSGIESGAAVPKYIQALDSLPSAPGSFAHDHQEGGRDSRTLGKAPSHAYSRSFLKLKDSGIGSEIMASKDQETHTPEFLTAGLRRFLWLKPRPSSQEPAPPQSITLSDDKGDWVSRLTTKAAGSSTAQNSNPLARQAMPLRMADESSKRPSSRPIQYTSIRPEVSFNGPKDLGRPSETTIQMPSSTMATGRTIQNSVPSDHISSRDWSPPKLGKRAIGSSISSRQPPPTRTGFASRGMPFLPRV